MFGVLPMAFTGDGIVVAGRLCEVAVMVVFPLPLALVVGALVVGALVVGRGVLAGLRRPCVAPAIVARTIAAAGVTLRYHFGQFLSPRVRSLSGPGAAADGVGACRPGARWIFHGARQGIHSSGHCHMGALQP